MILYFSHMRTRRGDVFQNTERAAYNAPLGHRVFNISVMRTYPAELTFPPVVSSRKCRRQAIDRRPRKGTVRNRRQSVYALGGTQCRRNRVSHQKSSIPLPTSCTTIQRRSKSVASSLNHGSLAPENTSSPTSRFFPRRTWNRGRGHFRILQPLLRITPKPWHLNPPILSQPRVGERAVGSGAFVAL